MKETAVHIKLNYILQQLYLYWFSNSKQDITLICNVIFSFQTFEQHCLDALNLSKVTVKIFSGHIATFAYKFVISNVGAWQAHS